LAIAFSVPSVPAIADGNAAIDLSAVQIAGFRLGITGTEALHQAAVSYGSGAYKVLKTACAHDYDRALKRGASTAVARCLDEIDINPSGQEFGSIRQPQVSLEFVEDFTEQPGTTRLSEIQVTYPIVEDDDVRQFANLVQQKYGQPSSGRLNQNDRGTFANFYWCKGPSSPTCDDSYEGVIGAQWGPALVRSVIDGQLPGGLRCPDSWAGPARELWAAANTGGIGKPFALVALADFAYECQQARAMRAALYPPPTF
jgi:hypothetical protein